MSGSTTTNGTAGVTLPSVKAKSQGHTGLDIMLSGQVSLGRVRPSGYSRPAYLGPVGVVSQVTGPLRQGGSALFQFNGLPGKHVNWTVQGPLATGSEVAVALCAVTPPSIPCDVYNASSVTTLPGGLIALNEGGATLIEGTMLLEVPVMGEGVTGSVSGQIAYSWDSGANWQTLEPQSLLLVNGLFEGPETSTTDWQVPVSPEQLLSNLVVRGILKVEVLTGSAGITASLTLSGVSYTVTIPVGSMRPLSNVTDSYGRAYAVFTANTLSGPFTVEVSYGS